MLGQLYNAVNCSSVMFKFILKKFLNRKSYQWIYLTFDFFLKWTEASEVVDSSLVVDWLAVEFILECVCLDWLESVSFSSTGSNLPTKTGPEPSVRFGDTNFGPLITAETRAIRALICSLDSIWGSLVQFETVGLDICRRVVIIFEPAIEGWSNIEEWSRNVRQ